MYRFFKSTLKAMLLLICILAFSQLPASASDEENSSLIDDVYNWSIEKGSEVKELLKEEDSPDESKNGNFCNKVVGNWAWDKRAFPATIHPDGTVVGDDGGKTITATWTCSDDEKGQIVVNWSTGFIDTLTLSSDGNSMIDNNHGRHLVVVRRESSYQSDRCSLIVGEWAWDKRAFPATIYSDGTVVGNDGGKRISGEWKCLRRAKGQIVVTWNTGHTDTLMLSSDGYTMTAHNKGYRFTVKRRY